MKKHKRIIGVVLLILSISLLFIGCGSDTYEKTTVNAKVVGVEWVAETSWTTLIPAGKGIMMPVTNYSPENYFLHAEYEGLSITVDSKELYETVKVGESIPVTLVERYSKEGQLERSYLRE